MPSQLTFLKINKFRHVLPGSEIYFKPQFNVVVGQNGTGKTTLLNLVSAIIRNNFYQFVQEGFSIEFRLAENEIFLSGTLDNTITNNRPSFKFSGQISWPGGTAQIRSDDSGAVLSSGDEEFEAPSITPAKNELEFGRGLFYAVLLVLIKAGVMPDSEMKIDVMRSIVDNTYFLLDAAGRLTEGVDTFNDLFASEARGKGQPLGFIFFPEDGEEPPNAVGRALSISLLSPEQLNQIPTVDTIAFGAEIPPLKHFLRLTQYDDARLILVKTTAGALGGSRMWTFGSPLARFLTPSGDEIPHDYLSFGEKRLLAFLLKLFSHTPTVIVDELANGMHHSWIEECIELIENLNSQAIMTSQNPLLLDCLPMNRDTYARAHTLVICELTDSGEMVWRNLTEAETEDFFRSLDVGLQHVSEIMRAKGLW